MTQYTIRKIRQKELPLMEDFLYEAIFLPEGAASPPKSIVKNEDLQVYVRDFGLSSDDNCYKKYRSRFRKKTMLQRCISKQGFQC